MNKFWLTVIGITAAIVALSNLGSIVGLAVSLVITYIGVKGYFSSRKTWLKVVFASVAIIAGLSAVLNVPAILGVIAVYVLYVVWKKWNNSEAVSDFSYFEKQWQDLKKKSY
ncbi:ABC transporter permease [Jeotgalibacillus salarius]|uniref:ABC transporter permease n=1 Tax=Jeotgalibacillus salarius TaxID=546023 RepID=A0A4Y8LDM2_9BACL|nr:ABC transporter permease [Jeotgalibacillus salarius]TFD99592.1 ABC transporter permease [Jeotgalibacillus salarius]